MGRHQGEEPDANRGQPAAGVPTVDEHFLSAVLAALGVELRRARERQSRTALDVATRCAVDASLVTGLENGASESALRLALAACVVTGVRLSDVVRRAENAVLARQIPQRAAQPPGAINTYEATENIVEQGDGDTLGGHLARVRDEAQLGQLDAARALGWPIEELQAVEANRRGVSVAELRGVLALCGITAPQDVAWFVALLPLPCDHHCQIPVVLCLTCRAVSGANMAGTPRTT
jgi:transcriptional regulator with XRE-family HTH domain